MGIMCWIANMSACAQEGQRCCELWIWDYRQLVIQHLVMWVLGTQLEPSVKAVSALRPRHFLNSRLQLKIYHLPLPKSSSRVTCSRGYLSSFSCDPPSSGNTDFSKFSCYLSVRLQGLHMAMEDCGCGVDKKRRM